MAVDLNIMATNIKTVLSGVSGVKEAFDHEPQSMANLPAATLFFDGFSQSEKTTKRSGVDWQWTIRLYVPMRTSDIKSPQTDIRNLIQATLQQFRSNVSLSGACLFHTIASGDVFALLEQNNPMMAAELTLVATTEE